VIEFIYKGGDREELWAMLVIGFMTIIGTLKKTRKQTGDFFC
jgi:hypothetical protein